MTSIFHLSIPGLLIAVILLAGDAYADTFEFLSYTPPRGWIKQVLKDGTIYKRPSGIGLITLYPSRPASGSASDEFIKMWRACVEPAVPGPAPQSQSQGDGDYTLAVGERQINIQGASTSVVLTVIVGRGRAVGVLTTGAGDDVLRELAEFLNNMTIIRGAPGSPVAAATTANGSGRDSAGGIEVDFDPPTGYVARQNGRMIELAPKTFDEKTPCAYGLSPARPSSGNLEADARAAILEALPGWEIKADHQYNALRGVAAAGWPYYVFATDVKKLEGGSYKYLEAVTMAFPSGSGRVNILWGFGPPAHVLNDLSLVRLFHSLRPRGWNSDGGKAFLQELQGTWRDSNSSGLAQYKFMANGRYEYGYGVITSTGIQETRFSSVSDGRYELRGSELTLIPDRRDHGPSKYRVRIYDELFLGRWSRAISFLDDSAKAALEVQYMRIDNSR
ncbi:MAG TPA: hypothetical protein VFY40_17025 [Blastocatellia bacterium]|nr:hypothetical protein [Blastocatellia bacterium]